MIPYNEIDHDIHGGSMKLTTEKFNEIVKSTTSTVTVLNIPWVLTVFESDGKIKVKLSCNENSVNTMWNCEADLEIRFNIVNGKMKTTKTEPVRKVFDYKNKFLEKKFPIYENSVELRTGFEKNVFEVEVNLKLIKVYGYRKRKILNYTVEHPRFSDGIILIDGIEIYVNKQILAMHSKYFDNLFFGNFVEKNKKVIEIHGIPYDGFITFLDFIHPTGRLVELHFVEMLMQLADLFVVDRVMEYCEDFLIKTDSVETSKKMILAEKYSLHNLMVACLNSFKTTKSLLELKKSECYFDMSDEIKSSLLERAVQLHKELN